jgi:hypothetical protein
VTNAPVDEQIGRWNVVEKQCEEFVGIFYKLQIYLFNEQSLVACVATAPSQLFREGK